MHGFIDSPALDVWKWDARVRHSAFNVTVQGIVRKFLAL
jgi:hypothetical protein